MLLTLYTALHAERLSGEQVSALNAQIDQLIQLPRCGEAFGQVRKHAHGRAFAPRRTLFTYSPTEPRKRCERAPVSHLTDDGDG